MLQFIAHHHFWIAVAAYWIFCAAVSALPEPAGNGSPVYLWLYRFSHTIAGNLTTVLRSRIPGLKTTSRLVAHLPRGAGEERIESGVLRYVSG